MVEYPDNAAPGAEAKQRYNKKLAYGFLVFAIVVGAAILLFAGDNESVAPPEETAIDQQGLSEAQKQEIYQALIVAEGRARSEADQQVPVTAGDPESIENNTSLVQELTAEYHAEVRAQYGITEDQQWAIAAEGVSNQWPRD